MLLVPIKRSIELLDSDWMEKIGKDSEIEFKLNGIEVFDNREKLESILNDKNVKYEIEQPIVAEVNKKQYVCKGYRFNVIDDKVVGLALEYLHIQRNYIESHLGVPDNISLLLGTVYSMYHADIDGHIWEYKKLNLTLTFDEQQTFARTCNVGRKLHYLDSY